MTDQTEAISRLRRACSLADAQSSRGNQTQFTQDIRTLLDRLEGTQALLELVEYGKRNIEASLREEIAGIMTRYDEVMSRLDSAERDAGRYRWLRHGDNDEKVLCNGPIVKDYWYLLRAEKLDAAIDEQLRSVGDTPEPFNPLNHEQTK